MRELKRAAEVIESAKNLLAKSIGELVDEYETATGHSVTVEDEYLMVNGIITKHIFSIKEVA